MLAKSQIGYLSNSELTYCNRIKILIFKITQYRYPACLCKFPKNAQMMDICERCKKVVKSMNENLIDAAVDQLLDFNASIPLSHYVTFNGNKIRYTNIPDCKKGLYAFWLTNNDGIVETLNRSLEIKGPGNKHYPFWTI